MPRLPVHVFEGKAALPYCFDESAGADSLVVMFPKLEVGRAEPRPAVGRLLAVDAHRLYLGADEQTFIGPRARLHGLRTAVDLIHDVAARVGVARERIACVGTSMGGLLSVLIGLPAGAGEIFAGAAPMLVGSSLERFHRAGIDVGPKEHAARFLELGRSGPDADPVEFLDALPFRAARKAEHPARIHLYTSPGDYAYRANRRFSRRFANHSLLDVSLTVAEFQRHKNVGDGFWPFVSSVLAGVHSEAEPR